MAVLSVGEHQGVEAGSERGAVEVCAGEQRLRACGLDFVQQRLEAFSAERQSGKRLLQPLAQLLRGRDARPAVTLRRNARQVECRTIEATDHALIDKALEPVANSVRALQSRLFVCS